MNENYTSDKCKKKSIYNFFGIQGDQQNSKSTNTVIENVMFNDTNTLTQHFNKEAIDNFFNVDQVQKSADSITTSLNTTIMTKYTSAIQKNCKSESSKADTITSTQKSEKKLFITKKLFVSIDTNKMLT